MKLAFLFVCVTAFTFLLFLLIHAVVYYCVSSIRCCTKVAIIYVCDVSLHVCATRNQSFKRLVC